MTGRGPEDAALNTYRLRSERFLLEAPTNDDAPTLFGLAGGEDRLEVTAGLIWDGPDEISEIRQFIEESRTTSYGEHGFNWVIRDRDGRFGGAAGAALGMIGTRPSGEPGRGHVGYWLGKPYWGHGLMGEALTSVLDLCFGELDMVKIEAEVFDTNVRGMRLVERLGMRLEGTIRSAHLKRGVWVDTHVSGLLGEEWRRARLGPGP